MEWGYRMDIRNIFCVGRNYAAHAAELENEVPEEPILFLKPTNAITWANGREIVLPKTKGSIHHELEIVLYIGKNVEGSFSVNDVVTKMSLGIDFTLRDVQGKLKSKGYPWLLAKGFKNSAVLTPFWTFPGIKECERTDFSLMKNGQTVQKGNIKSLIFDFQTLLEYIQQHFGLKKGDIIYTGTPEGVGPVEHGDMLTLHWGDVEKGSIKIKKSEIFD